MEAPLARKGAQHPTAGAEFNCQTAPLPTEHSNSFAGVGLIKVNNQTVQNFVGFCENKHCGITTFFQIIACEQSILEPLGAE